MARVTCLLVLLLGITFVAAKTHYKAKASETFAQELFNIISKDQVKKDEAFVLFKHWERNKGLYSSGVKLNMHGNFEVAEPRRLLDVFDNNMFVTAWVTTSLLEAYKYGEAPRPSDQQLEMALNSFKEYQDKNLPYNTSAMTFWPQTYNETTKFWECTPVNLLGAFQMASDMPISLIAKLLDLIGLGQLAKDIESILNMKDTFLRAFHIPPDFDDSFVNIGLGTLLYEMKDQFPNAWKLWSSHNTNITSVFDALKRYAYRPFSNDRDLNTIDPRTYFHIRGFLDQAEAQGQDVALVPTWIQNLKEVRTDYYLGAGMPFEINNVDLTVSANTIFGITSSVLAGVVSPQVLKDPVIEQIYHNTSALIAYEIKTNFTNRPDLALTYYPSKIEFYWFVARTVSVIEAALKTGPLPLEVINTVYHLLRDAVEGPMTQEILSQAKYGGVDKKYFDDFLGDGDVTLTGKPLIRGEDRIFTTAMAVNALVTTWTYYDPKTGKSHWKQGSQAAEETASGCVNWLRQHTLDGNYDPWNAFFSGSSKGLSSMPFWFPANRFEYLNGTVIKDWSDIPNSPFIYGVQGYVSPQQYNDMLKEKHFGTPTPMTFNGYNTGESYFPFWSSVPYTYATALLAVSRFESIVG